MSPMFKRCLILLTLLADCAWAARPFVTDDARLTLANSCQLETWTRVYATSQELWALPACNLGGNLEITAGAGAAHNVTGTSGWNADYVFQVKTLFKNLESNGWGIGIAAGNIHHPQINPGPNLMGNHYAYIPVSVSWMDDLLIMHVNLGGLHDKASGRNQATWGLGSEINMDERWTWIAESFGSSNGSTYWQAGLRYSVIPGLLQVDTTIGRPFDKQANSQWLSFGLRLTPADLLSR